MCGILGWAATKPIDGATLLVAAAEQLRHRGPDDSGEWWSQDRRVGLAHRRLAIIDLSPGGHQPMVDEGRNAIVLNGEVYNYRELRAELAAKGHRFCSASDTEVLLAAYREWGLESLGRLNGQFAFALYDTSLRKLFVARDRAGEKPLYYRLDASGFRFASELKGLLHDSAVPRRIDRTALDCYLAMGYVPGERTILDGMKKLPPAHAIAYEVDTGRSTCWRYWQLPPLETSAGHGNEGDLLPELEQILQAAVSRQLVADVPVGVLLSGGTDSSLVTAMAARAVPRVKTFTIRFPGFGEFDETDHARLIARHFGTEHLELVAEPASADLLPVLARQFDEPLADSSMIPTYLVSRLIREHCTVALGGDGGDELFGGYPHYRRLLWLQRVTALVPRAIRRVGTSAIVAMMPVGLKGRNWFDAAGADWVREVPPVDGLFDAVARRGLMRAYEWEPVAEAVRASRTPAEPDLLQRATRMDFENYLAEDLLVKVDRASMLNSLEVRAPFLDPALVEFAFARIPSALKATASGQKILLKRLCDRVLPAGFQRDRKQGFTLPLGQWLEAGPWADLFRDVLLGDGALFDQATTRSLLAGQRRGRHNSERLFALALFELWRREYRATL